MQATIQLPENIIRLLARLPENGMGYQIVKVKLKSGKVVHDLKVLNSEILMLEGNDFISSKDIETIELEEKN